MADTYDYYIPGLEMKVQVPNGYHVIHDGRSTLSDMAYDPTSGQFEAVAWPGIGAVTYICLARKNHKTWADKLVHTSIKMNHPSRKIQR